MKPLRRVIGLTVFIAVLILGVPASPAQNALEFQFQGFVTSMNPGSTALPSVQVGSFVSGSFTLDAGAIDSDSSPTFGRYTSSLVKFSGRIGSDDFSLVPGPGNAVHVSNVTIPENSDWVIFPGSTQLTFYDPSGLTLANDSLPLSADVYNAFPSFDLFIQDERGFGSYVMDVTIVPVPEPTTAGILLVASLIFIPWHLRSRFRAARNIIAESKFGPV